jgi:carboxylate-amine ligase
MKAPHPPRWSTNARELRELFDRPAPLTVGLEEELFLLDRDTLLPAPHALDVVRAAGDPRFVGEMPAAQLESVGPACADASEGGRSLLAARADLAAAAASHGVLVGAGVPPLGPVEGVLNRSPRYDAMAREYGAVARRQLVAGLHVHVCLRGAERVVAVHDALRSFLPELAALAANAPFQDGRDTGMASIRPKIAELLPRQGLPPALGSIDAYAGALAWGTRGGVLKGPGQWWWELRLHGGHGTIEVRVCDAQPTAGESAALGAVVHALVAWLAARHDDGERLPVHPGWRIAENRWAAARHGLDAALADLDTGERRPARERLAELLDELAGVAGPIGALEGLAAARRTVAAGNGAERQRACGDATAAAAWLTGAFLTGGVPSVMPPANSG